MSKILRFPPPRERELTRQGKFIFSLWLGFFLILVLGALL